MRHYTTFLYLCFITFISSLHAQIVTNGSFDSNSSGWTAVNNFTLPSKAAFTYSSTGGNPGGYIKIKTTGTNGGSGYWKASQINVPSGQTYKFYFDYKTNCYNTYVRIDYYSGPNESGWVGFEELSDTVLYGLPSLNLASGWTSKRFPILVPAGANYAIISCRAHAQWGESGFDNIKLTASEPFLSLSTNTSGPRYLIDSDKQPFQLFAMARCQNLSDEEDAAYNGLNGLCGHFKNLGCNAIRLAIATHDISNTYDRVLECGGYNPTGIQNYITKYIDPEVKTIISNGMYVILDLHAYPPCDNAQDIVPYARTHYIPIWTELAKRYADEPMIAIFELWNEPYPADQRSLPMNVNGTITLPDGSVYDWSADVRQFYIDCAQAVRLYDTKHIMLLSDFNAGWGTAWPVTWDGHEYDADPTYKKIMYSIHAAREHLDTEFTYYNSWWAGISNSNNIALHLGEIETEGDLMSTVGMQNFVSMLEARKATYHYSSALWRPHDDVNNYVSVWNSFARNYTTWPDTKEIFIEPEDAFSGAVYSTTGAGYFSSGNVYPGGAIQLDPSAAQYSFGYVTLAEYLGPESYSIRIRTFGDATNSVTQGIYYEDMDDSSHVLIGFIPGRTDQKFHTDQMRFSASKPFNKIIVKKMDASASGANPVDQLVISRSFLWEAENSSGAVQAYNDQYASSGMIAAIPGSFPQWSYYTVALGSFKAPGKYLMKIRFYGDVQNTAQQGVYFADENGNHVAIAYLDGIATNGFYERILVFTSTVPFNQIILKKSVSSTAGTNPIDYFLLQRF